MNLIWECPETGARLFQGGETDVERMRLGMKKPVDVIALMASHFQPEPFGKVRFVRGRLYDDPDMTGAAYDETLKIARAVADQLEKHLRAGRSVLSSCQMGWNRSGLATSLTLLRVLGQVDPMTVIHWLRRARHPRAMSNPAFVRMVFEEAARRRRGRVRTVG